MCDLFSLWAWLRKPVQWREALRERLAVLEDVRALVKEKKLVAASEKFYGDETARLCVRLGYQIERGDYTAAKETRKQMEVVQTRCKTETNKLKGILYEIEHRNTLLDRHRPKWLR